MQKKQIFNLRNKEKDVIELKKKRKWRRIKEGEEERIKGC